MKVALLCNGPSRRGFLFCKKEYNYVMGCNASWYEHVDSTVIVDEVMVDKWFENKELIKCKAHFSKKAWIHASINKYKDFFKDKVLSIVDVAPEYDSSGHVAAKILMKEGWKKIDIWGADSWFDNTIASYTHSITPNLNADDSPKHIKGWREHWQKLIDNNLDVDINFRRNEHV